MPRRSAMGLLWEQTPLAQDLVTLGMWDGAGAYFMLKPTKTLFKILSEPPSCPSIG